MAKFEVSGNVGGNDSITVLQGQFDGRQHIQVAIPAGKRLFVNITRFNFVDSNARFGITANGALRYTSNTDDGEENPNKRLFRNRTGSEVEIELGLGAFAPTENVALFPDDGWYALFEIR